MPRSIEKITVKNDAILTIIQASLGLGNIAASNENIKGVSTTKIGRFLRTKDILS